MSMGQAVGGGIVQHQEGKMVFAYYDFWMIAPAL